MSAYKPGETAQTYKEEGDTILINTYQDVAPHIEYAKACRRADAENRGRFGKRPDMHHTMSVPTNVILGIASRLGIAHGDALKKEYSERIFEELKRPEFAVYRTSVDKRI